LIGRGVAYRDGNDERRRGRAIAAHRNLVAWPNRCGKLGGQMWRDMHLRAVPEQESIEIAARRQRENLYCAS
jgi:hypothetical protein